MSQTETAEAKPITAFVLIPFTDADGKHKVGEKVDFAREDKDGVDRLIDYGVLSKTPPPAEDPAQAQG